MIRNSYTTIANVLAKHNSINFVLPCTQCVRYKKTPRRKPIGLPVAKSKEFEVRQPTPKDPEETKELEIRYEEYRASVRGIRNFLKQEMSKRVILTTEKQELNIAADLEWMEAETNKWNKKIAESRDARQLEERISEQERISNLMQKQAETRLQRVSEAEKILKKEKEASSSFVTADTLDLEIERMLDRRSDYNFAVTLEGEVLAGEEPAHDKAVGGDQGQASSAA